MDKESHGYKVDKLFQEISEFPIDDLSEKVILRNNCLITNYYLLEFVNDKNDINDLNYEKFKRYIENKDLTKFIKLHPDIELTYTIRTQIVRIKEAIEVSLLLIKQGKILTLPLIIRFIMELYISIEYCEYLMSKYIVSDFSDEEYDKLVDNILRLSSGTKKSGEFSLDNLKAINILTLIDKSIKKGKNDESFKDDYNHLSEFTHSNVPYNIPFCLSKIDSNSITDVYSMVSNIEFRRHLLILIGTLKKLEIIINDYNNIIENQIEEEFKTLIRSL